MGFQIRMSVLTVLVGTVVIASAQQLLPGSGFVPQQQQKQEISDSSPSPSSVQYRTRPYDYSEESEEENVPASYQIRRPQAPQQQHQQQQQYKKPLQQQRPTKEEIEDELEEEEPDRLTVLLEKSTFTCDDRKTGYYADEGLDCEVFHYCHESTKHSWICPDGFRFHQVHLICMPGDNICERSSSYHVVNDYLYKPINMAEHESKPNVTLRYSERYYPEDIYHDERQDEREEHQHERYSQQRQPIQVGLVRKSPVQPTTPLPYRQQQIQIQAPQQHHVFRSPDEINISLQQRRPNPNIYSQQTPRYENDEYHYEN